eukprot:gene8102-10108_t
MERTVEVNILLFAECKERAGTSSLELSLPSETCPKDIFTTLTTRYPSLKGVLSSVVLALNEEYIDMDSMIRLKESDTLAIIPPLSGG